ncbi:leucine-rich repeat receptor protein kinase ems1 [Anaeramoeba flamelloides]|uniref:Leucine-rich repeat receptor protein kinase ems1 n=1 Tax=Anaeramoeba flamelloides TaxID=1746091 RepID=A0AAV7Y655_9EUKA|nr:leucine-rich repeat receptor protein kinase ems1 [Anaeramoeba flamelloides]
MSNYLLNSSTLAKGYYSHIENLNNSNLSNQQNNTSILLQKKFEQALKNATDVLDLSDQELSNNIVDLQYLTKLEKLYLDHNDFRVIPISVCSLTKLVFLSMTCNRLVNFPDEFFQNLKQLEVLNLNSNKINLLPVQIGQLTSLNKLSINNNSIEVLPNTIGKLVNLKEIFLSDNFIRSLPSQISNLKQLQKLELGGNNLTVLPSSIGNLTLLIYLGLSFNFIEQIPTEISKLTLLEELYINDNQLKSLPEEIGSLKSLRELELSNNSLEILPENIGNLQNLQFLYCNHNQIEKIPSSMCNLELLSILWLDSNQLKEIPTEIGNLKRIICLKLNDNQLITFPDSVCKCISLNELTVYNNPNLILPTSINQLPLLQKLIITEDQIGTLPTPLNVKFKADNKNINNKNKLNHNRNNNQSINKKQINFNKVQKIDFFDQDSKLKISQNIDQKKKKIQTITNNNKIKDPIISTIENSRYNTKGVIWIVPNQQQNDSLDQDIMELNLANENFLSLSPTKISDMIYSNIPYQQIQKNETQNKAKKKENVKENGYENEENKFQKQNDNGNVNYNENENDNENYNDNDKNDKQSKNIENNDNNKSIQNDNILGKLKTDQGEKTAIIISDNKNGLINKQYDLKKKNTQEKKLQKQNININNKKISNEQKNFIEKIENGELFNSFPYLNPENKNKKNKKINTLNNYNNTGNGHNNSVVGNDDNTRMKKQNQSNNFLTTLFPTLEKQTNKKFNTNLIPLDNINNENENNSDDGGGDDDKRVIKIENNNHNKNIEINNKKNSNHKGFSVEYSHENVGGDGNMNNQINKNQMGDINNLNLNESRDYHSLLMDLDFLSTPNELINNNSENLINNPQNLNNEKIQKEWEQIEQEKEKMNQEKKKIAHFKKKLEIEWISFQKQQKILKKRQISQMNQMKILKKQLRSLQIYKQISEESHNEIDPNEIFDLEEIGSGAFGKVYKSMWRRKTVAVKRIKPEYLQGNYLIEFKREIMMLSKTRHPNIVLFMGACTIYPNVFIVTEYCEEGSLYHCLRKKKMIKNINQKIRIAREIALAMNYLHLTKPRIVIHRDLKSTNVLLDKFGTVKIADFGMSRIKDESLKHTGFRGSPCWMAPEVFRNENYSEKIDVYSYGIVLWEIFTKKFPYKGIKNPMQIAFNVGFKNLRPSIEKITDLKWRSLITRCWDKNPSKRPSFQEILIILDTLDEN